jgi:hypothetical protein
MIKAKLKKAIASRKEIQRGDSTHHQDQVICPVSFRPINNTVRRPGNPIPLEEEELLLDMKCLSLYEYNITSINRIVKG